MRKFPRPSQTPPIKNGGSITIVLLLSALIHPLLFFVILPVYIFISTTIGDDEFDIVIQDIVYKYLIKFMMILLPVLLLLNFIQDGIVETVEENSKELCLFFILTIIDVIYVIIKLGSRKDKELPKNDDSLENKDDFNIE